MWQKWFTFHFIINKLVMKIIKKIKAGAMVINWDNTYLVYRERFDDYSFPKGSLEKWESLEEAALREVLEEIGIKWVIQWYIDIISYSFTQDDTIFDCEVHYFLMTIDQYITNKLADDIDSISLVKITDLNNILTYKEDKHILQMALSKYPEFLWNKN